MKIVVENADYYDRSFINYLKKYTLRMFQRSCDRKKLSIIDHEFDIDSYKIICILLKLLKISKYSDKYVLSIDKNLKLQNQLLSITYGNRSVKGYPIVLNIFSFVENNIDSIHERWLRNGN